MVRVRVARADLESWKRAAAPRGGVSTWLRQAASRAVESHATLPSTDLERGAPVEVVELRASASEAASWREAAGDGGVASWLRGVAAAELGSLGAPVPADVKLPDAGAADHTAAPEPRWAPEASPATPGPPAAPTAAPVVPVTAPAFPGEDAEDRRRRSMSLAEVLACPHPTDELKRTGYVAFCLRCGRRMEGRDSWTGAGWAGWSPALLAACPHPEAERRSHAWGSSCGVCGRLLRDPTP
jgi:hypothetical protein